MQSGDAVGQPAAIHRAAPLSALLAIIYAILETNWILEDGEMKSLCFSSRRVIFVLCLASVLGLPLSRAMAQYTPATAAFDNSPVCSDSDLSNDHDLARGQPEWKPVNGLAFDPSSPRVLDKPTVLEGRILPPPSLEQSGDIAHTEVAEEDLPWNHYTHDFTIKVTPDPDYQYLLSSWVRYPGQTISDVTAGVCSILGGSFTNNTCVLHPPDTCPDGSMDATCHHDDMEVEWESASLMDASEGFNRIWGAIPEFVWPAVYDRVWVAGRWIFDCGHPGVHDFDTNQKADVQYSTEIHPPRALVTFRLNHPALD
ncbi:MAG: hypothetical protein WCC59_11625, partial [Terriglobales bacterium]